MSGRYRSQGFLTTNACQKTFDYTAYVCKNRLVNGQWEYYLAEEPASTSLATYREGDLCEISDTVGEPAKFNGVAHTRRYLVPFWITGGTLAIQFPYPNYPYWLNQVMGGVLPAVTGVFSPHMMFGGYDYPSTYSFQDQDWDALIQSVGDQLSGAMEAKANILVFLGEAAKTIRMLRNPFGLVNGSYRSVKNLSSFLHLASNGYLEYRYGWKQLERDMIALFTSYARARTHRTYLQVTRSQYTGIHERDEASVDVNIPYPSIGSSSYPYWITATSAKATRTCVFGVEILRGAQYRIASQMETMLEGLGSKQVLEAAWDLIPFSFLVDWFVDIGRVVATDPILWNTHRLRRIGYSTKTTLTMSFTSHSKVPHSVGTEECQTDSVLPSQVVYKSYTRTPGFPPGNADLFGNFRLTNIADGAALLAQRLL